LFFVSIAVKVEAMDEIIKVLAVVITGPLAGVEFGVAAFTNPIFARLPEEAFRAARSDGSRLLGKVMPFWYVATLLVLIAAAVLSASVLVGVAATLMAAVVLLTVTVLVPINNRIGGWSAEDAWSADEEPSRNLARQWDRLHWLRVAGLLVIVVLVTVALAQAA
jgi:hypothetical protein